MQKIDVLKIGAIVPTPFLLFSISQGARQNANFPKTKCLFHASRIFKVYPGAGGGTIKSMLPKNFEKQISDRSDCYANEPSTILTGAAVTAAVGTAAYMMTGKKKNTAKQLKKKAGKAVQAVGDIVESISSIMG